MIESLSPVISSRLEKAAVDNGFDQALPRQGDWLGFWSTQCPLRIWLGGTDDGVLLAAFSRQNVARALGELGAPTAAPLPAGALAGRAVSDVPALHRMLRRAFQLGRTLPDELLHSFQRQTAALPRTTEAERLVVQRVGQDLFRQGLLEYWDSRCAVTGLAVPALLRASHIKPWADCATDAERLDVFNGLLLAPHLDAVFDAGFITVADEGTVIVASDLDDDARRLLGLDHPLSIRMLTDEHRAYLPSHRTQVFGARHAREPQVEASRDDGLERTRHKTDDAS